MFIAQPGPIQSWKYAFNSAANFCVWTLKIDGLHVSPFNHHPAYKGPLQEAGLNAENWMQWFQKVVLEQQQNPLQVWSVTGLPTRLIEELWQRYMQQASLEEDDYNIFLQSSIKKFYRELEPFYTYLPTCTISFIDYSDAVQLSLARTFALISIPNKSRDEEALKKSFIQCLTQLGSLADMPLNYEEAHQEKRSILQKSLQKEIQMLPSEMQKQIAFYLPKIDQLPVTILEWFNTRLRIFHMFGTEEKVEGVIEHQEVIVNQQCIIVNVRDNILVIPLQEIPGAIYSKISVGQKISIHLLSTQKAVINFSYALT